MNISAIKLAGYFAILAVGIVAPFLFPGRVSQITELWLFIVFALTWDLVSIFTGLDPAGLEQAGVHVGSRAVVARERKSLQRLGDYVASFTLDDRMGLTVLIAALKELSRTAGGSRHDQPDLYFVATHGEEIGMLGGVRAGQLIRPDLCVAIDTAPVASLSLWG